jgi:hypothetical protein
MGSVLKPPASLLGICPRRARCTLAAFLVISGCKKQETPRPSEDQNQQAKPRLQYGGDLDASAYEPMRASDLVPIFLDRVRTVPLGADPIRTPASVARAKITRRGIVVIDEAARMVREYSKVGEPSFVIPIGSEAGSNLKSPVALASRGDTLLVLDLDPNRGITAFDTSGREIANTPVKVPASTVDYVVTQDAYVVATIADTKEIADGAGVILWAVEKNGDATAFGCAPDSLYRRSIKNTGLFQLFRFFGVSSAGEQTFCRQPLSPVVHILDAKTRSVALLRRAPPFYQRPGDIPQTMNNVVVSKFRSTWTEHARFFPRARGFISVYTTFDSQIGRDKHLLFACDSTSGATRCGTRESPGMPLDFLSPDTLVIVEPLKGSRDVQRISFYRIRM